MALLVYNLLYNYKPWRCLWPVKSHRTTRSLPYSKAGLSIHVLNMYWIPFSRTPNETMRVDPFKVVWWFRLETSQRILI